MLITIQHDSAEPIYLQLYSKIVSSIATGALRANDTLPSSRKLAKDLSINYHTVTKAYQLLEMEGFVRIVKKRVEVSSATPKDREEFIVKFETIETELIYEARAKGLKNEFLLKLFQELLIKVGA